MNHHESTEWTVTLNWRHGQDPERQGGAGCVWSVTGEELFAPAAPGPTPERVRGVQKARGAIRDSRTPHTPRCIAPQTRIEGSVYQDQVQGSLSAKGGTALNK